MTTDPIFTTPSEPVQQARLAMARLEAHLARVIDPCDPECDLASVAFAFMSLEDVYPPYPPLPPGIAPSTDPHADLHLAVAALGEAGLAATGPAEILRYAYTIRDLRELEDSPYLRVRVHDDGATGDWFGW